jgi:hypothetical protein
MATLVKGRLAQSLQGGARSDDIGAVELIEMVYHLRTQESVAQRRAKWFPRRIAKTWIMGVS